MRSLSLLSPMGKSKKYWKGVEERKNTAAFRETLESEFPEAPEEAEPWLGGDVPEAAVSRRSFLKAAGFSVAGSTLASCSRGPVERAIPLLKISSS